MHELTCKACGAQFDSQEDLDEHNHQSHPEMTSAKDDELMCQMCGTRFGSKEELDKHNKEEHET